MMKLDMKNGRDWQGFNKILDIMSFVDTIEDSAPHEIRENAERLCELPAEPSHTMSMEEVIFWAGVATGMEIWRNAEEEKVDPSTAEKMLVFSSIFSHSTKNAIIDLALGQLEPDAEEEWQNTGGR
jgi:hypothetical protein